MKKKVISGEVLSMKNMVSDRKAARKGLEEDFMTLRSLATASNQRALGLTESEKA